MRIYSMTATFGKLNHETLTLNPGLNVITAPNEWGKSTWCAFLVNMLYGIDTKQRSGGANLPDKERYAPWSGAPMAGRIDLNWNGRDITIERSSKGRVIFGNFRAYETQTGLDVPELDGTNCGRMLLGVERSVFTRSGFIRLSDMPVTADDALRRRLNDLVTTGDESGDGDKLGSALRELKNKCRYNNSGLLPQAENEREQLRRQLDQITDLRKKTDQLQQHESTLSEQISALSNHETTLRYNAAREDAIRVERAEAALAASSQKVIALEEQLQLLPDPSQAQTALDAGNQLSRDLEALELERRLLPPEPEPPVIPGHFTGLSPEQALALSRAHYARNQELETARKKHRSALTFLLITAGLMVIAAVVGLLLSMPIISIAASVLLLLCVIFAFLSLSKSSKQHTELQTLYSSHPGLSPDGWIEDAQAYMNRQQYYLQAQQEHQRRLEDLQRREQLLTKQIALFAGEGTLEQRLTQWNQALKCRDSLNAAQQELSNQEKMVQTLKSMARTVTPPAYPDRLDLSMEQTAEQLAAAQAELQQVQAQLHQCRGRSEALGQEGVLRSRLDTLLRRISRLEDTYYALEMAQDALYKATTALQRRFAPRISKRAQSLFAQMTDGRYNRLTMSEDFSLSVCASEEDTMHSAQWRSDGTVDQLYLALRLAVAEELTPEAPLVLDDALVRYDDDRLKNAVSLLKQAGEEKQVILFSCQGREAELL